MKKTNKKKTDTAAEIPKRGTGVQPQFGSNQLGKSVPTLQQKLGNGFLQQLGNRTLMPVSAKDTQNNRYNGNADANLEREADQIADQVMRAPINKASSPTVESAAFKHHAMPGTTTKRVTIEPEVERVLSSPGSVMDSVTRGFMESQLGHDFSNVRIYTDAQASSSAHRLNAQAYTVRDRVVFDKGQYAPHTAEGRGLLAHELSHVIQQGGALPRYSAAESASGPYAMRLTSLAMPRIQMRRWGVGEIPPMSEAEFRQSVVIAAVDQILQNVPTLDPAFRRVLHGDPPIASINGPFNEAIRRAVGMSHADQLRLVSDTATNLVRTFILDPGTSSIDLLPERQRDRFRNFDWERDDYPGGPAGNNEGLASALSRQLSSIRPERRANSGNDAAMTRAEHTSQAERRIRDNLENIPNFPANPDGGAAVHNQPAGHRLYNEAQVSFVAMRAAALADGVPLIVLSSYRDPNVARRRAADAGNPNAVASFSSHSLGLAIDLRMSIRYTDAQGRQQNLRFTETTTRPMQNVVDMRESPVHKWMFLHGAEHGWFPYQNEPWHWEYNPDGFRERYQATIVPPAQPANADEGDGRPPAE